MASENVDITFLLKQLQQGSETAFSKIYDLYSKPVYRHVLRLVYDEDVAAEILQETFLAVWVKRDKINPQQSFSPFIYQIAKILVFSHYRKVSQNKRLLDHLIITTVDTVINAEEAIIDQETHQLLIKAIEHLPPQRKQVFKLCKFEGKSYQEVADLLDISTSTISNQIVAANKSIKEFFLLNNDLAVLIVTCVVTYFTIQNSIATL
ncbi:sigma-70 family RNA polymerase sigma factor [Mucilaginibacter rubeus]|uniref:Sigma-70 family RNA polymerase sigma factor n=1 Tax=Mucilaginibacter rubeus TaxID=2027860 RepID=A0AAE6MHC4_9SPHI|nr:MULTISPECIES: sigma-70 family RNA polymerase sigma factor [Mucilaginibacter]QEM03124.1 sigma-70 family RNA polymerase sigma factor [Mucilaginibacter rubeus]QEM15742.1 sigma-70 family RNA polymerase sigma factor [Mucilaginibacter gossypii]QTE41517.1 sigma-70 family RNA polymerase sigma factor [Mucilaginibacter rubeus]QTE48123.1 sigma-70 family RNA polymerase sigma factor [Mucilaginibacter rubeus]QTE59514.1 sigma-70 family RNA polymerase sigma factor [Mucilaginibacter rubeus]